MNRQRLWYITLTRRGVQEHRAHHTAPIDDHYCILSGFWNRALDGSGALVAAERALHALTGAKPRSWDGGDAPKPRR